MPDSAPLAPAEAPKFADPHRTADGSRRAWVALDRLDTLWINTGTLCNLTCRNCYIESSPTNDSLSYIRADEVRTYFEEIADRRLGTGTIGFTGGEPFMNPDFMVMLAETLARGFRALVLTNAMRPMMKCADALVALRDRFEDRLAVRVSLDHYTRRLHLVERGPRSWEPALDGLQWLSSNGFRPAVAGRTCWNEAEGEARDGYARLFAERDIDCDAWDPDRLVLFPEMTEQADMPEITDACWGILGKSPTDVMCSASRMVVKRRGAKRPAVVACTLLPYDPRFELGTTLAESSGAVPLNHVHCATFCVLGGGRCGGG